VSTVINFVRTCGDDCTGRKSHPYPSHYWDTIRHNSRTDEVIDRLIRFDYIYDKIIEGSKKKKELEEKRKGIEREGKKLMR